MIGKHKENKFNEDDNEIRFQAERLCQILKQEGVIGEDEFNIGFSRALEYLTFGEIADFSTKKEFFEKMMDIVERDKKGEWSKEYMIGEPVAKLENIEK